MNSYNQRQIAAESAKTFDSLIESGEMAKTVDGTVRVDPATGQVMVALARDGGGYNKEAFAVKAAKLTEVGCPGYHATVRYVA